MTTTRFTVEHNVEVAHRLTRLPGKCQQIHGHSMWISLTMAGRVTSDGLVAGLDFGRVKAQFREMLDSTYDHRLLLNQDDPLAALDLPGARLVLADPTVENIAAWVGVWALDRFPQCTGHEVTVRETRTNTVTWTAE